jgi:uncharacterized membrane protein (DUF4010 family)
MTELTTFAGLGVALACGLLIGLDREQKDSDEEFGGIRTYPLIALAGGLAQLVSAEIGTWFVGLTLFGLVAWIGVYYFNASKRGQVGMTSEFAALSAYLCGVLALQDHKGLAFAVAIAITVILALKSWLHGQVQRLSREDVVATLKFLVVAFVVLPLLPTETYSVAVPPDLLPEALGATEALDLNLINPRKVGWMVVLIAGLGFTGFVSTKLLSAKRGLGLTAFLGGLVSSTAVTLTFAGRAKATPALLNTCVVAILVASATMFVRVLVEVAAVAPSLLKTVALPIGAMGVTALLTVGFFWFRRSDQKDEAEEPKMKNPFELTEALKFGALFAVVLFVAGSAQTFFGSGGLYLSALLAGLTDVDAITLSAAELTKAETDPISHRVAATTITIAVLSNTVVKGFLAWSSGGTKLGLRVAGSFGLTAAVGLVVLLLFV